MIKNVNIGETERFDFFYSQSGVLNNTFLPLGQINKTMYINVRRDTDGFYWNGSAFQAGVVNIVMSQTPDFNNEPGYYYYDYTWTTVGKYRITIKDGATPVLVSQTIGYVCYDYATTWNAILNKVNPLPTDPASNTVVNTRLATASYIAPDNATIASRASQASVTALGAPMQAVSYVAPDNVSTLFSANMDQYSIEYDFTTYTKSIMKFYNQDRPFAGNADYWCYVYTKNDTKPTDFAEIAKRDRVKPWSTPPV